MTANATTNGSNGAKSPGEAAPPMDREKFERLITMVTNAGQVRSMFARSMYDRIFSTKINLNSECDYPETGTITVDMLQGLYDREPVAAAVVDYFPKQCWKISPLVYEQEDSETATPFEKSWDGLGRSLTGVGWHKQEKGSKVFEYLQRLEILAGIGSYGVLLLGLDDGLDLSEPVKGVEEIYSVKATKDNKTPTYNGQPYKMTVNAAKTKGRKLLYLRAFPQSLAEVTQWEYNPTSPRYCQPIMYSITFSSPTQSYFNMDSAIGTTRSVHWTRVHHLPSDQLASSEVLGIPKLLSVLNPVLDIQKIRGADGQGYWRNCFAQLFLEMLPEYADVKSDVTALRDMMEQMQNGLQKWGVLEGMTAKTLPPSLVDPTPHIAVHIQAISIKTGIPKRILEGSERGELASGQDADKAESDLNGRRDNYSTPRNLAPFIDRLIMVGVLEPPQEQGEGEEEGGYLIEWPKVESATDMEKAQIAQIKTASLVQYVSGGGEQLVAPMDFLTRFLEFDEEESQAMLDTSEEHMMEKEEEDMAKQQDLIDKGLAPDPNAPPPALPVKVRDGERLVDPKDGKPVGSAKGKGFPPKPSINEQTVNFLEIVDAEDQD